MNTGLRVQTEVRSADADFRRDVSPRGGDDRMVTARRHKLAGRLFDGYLVVVSAGS